MRSGYPTGPRPGTFPRLAGDRRGHERTVERNVVYGMHSGLALLMDVHRPAVPNGAGVIVAWGSAWTGPASYDGWQLKRLGAPPVFTDAGFTAFVVNHRLAPRFRHPAALEDVQRAVRFVRHGAERYGIDPERIGAYGASSGGHLVALLGVLEGEGSPDDRDPVERESSRVRAVATHAAPMDLAHPDYRNQWGPVNLLGLPPLPQDLPAYREASPISHVTPDDAPFLLVHGDADEVVPFETAEAMHRALREKGVAADLERVPGGGHGIPPDPVAAARWLATHLLGEARARELEPLFRRHETLDRGVALAREGRIGEALAAFEEARSGEDRVTVGFLRWAWLCRHGTVWGHAEQVMPACERAVELAPDDRQITAFVRESRGIARALLGDRRGAIEDLEAAVALAPFEGDRRRVEGWIEALRAGEDPFGAEVLEGLRP